MSVMLFPSKVLVKRALEEGWAVGAFNAINLETAEAIFAAAEKTRSPFILQITSTTVGTPEKPEYTKLTRFLPLIYALSKEATIPHAIHLDHGRSPDICKYFINAIIDGIHPVTSVMIDGSLTPDGKSPQGYKNNVAATKEVVEFVKSLNRQITIEGEIGNLGQVGVEMTEDGLTDPRIAAQFVRDTGVDILAVAIGTKHGLYKGIPHIYVDRVKEIAEAIGHIPLVMHGGTGVPDEVVKAAIRAGTAKINIDTEIRQAGTEALKVEIHAVEEEHQRAESVGKVRKYDLRPILGSMRKAMQEAIMKKMILFDSTGKLDSFVI